MKYRRAIYLAKKPVHPNTILLIKISKLFFYVMIAVSPDSEEVKLTLLLIFYI